MVDEYDRQLSEPNEERTCDIPQESTEPKLKAPGREVVYDYPTGVRSVEDEIAARRVEMTPNPAYGTLTRNMFQGNVHKYNNEFPSNLMFSESTTPDMVDKTTLNFLNSMKKEHATTYLSKSTYPKTTYNYVNICDPTEPTKEVVNDYPTGVGSGDEVRRS